MENVVIQFVNLADECVIALGNDLAIKLSFVSSNSVTDESLASHPKITSLCMEE